MSTQPLPDGENSPTRLVLFAALRLVERHDLPHVGRLRRLTVNQDDSQALMNLARAYLAAARHAVGEGTALRDAPGWDAGDVLVRDTVAATTIAHKIHAAACGVRAVAPSYEAWQVLAMVTLLVYVRDGDGNATHELIAYVNELAVEIAGL